MSERNPYTPFREVQVQLKSASPKKLGEHLTYYDNLKKDMGLIAVGTLFLGVASASINQLSENQSVDFATFGASIISTAVSTLSTYGMVKANAMGNVVAGELRSRGLKVPKGFVRRINS